MISEESMQATASAPSVLRPGEDSLLSGCSGVQFPAAVPEFGRSIASLLAALYGAICFEPGAQPALGRLRELFAPEGRLVHVKPDGVEVMDVETFIARFEEQVRLGGLPSFHEREVARTVQQFGNVAHVFSTFEAWWSVADAQPFARGINSIQLWRQNDRWHVASLIWDDERPDDPIPEEYLKFQT